MVHGGDYHERELIIARRARSMDPSFIGGPVIRAHHPRPARRHRLVRSESGIDRRLAVCREPPCGHHHNQANRLRKFERQDFAVKTE